MHITREFPRRLRIPFTVALLLIGSLGGLWVKSAMSLPACETAPGTADPSPKVVSATLPTSETPGDDVRIVFDRNLASGSSIRVRDRVGDAVVGRATQPSDNTLVFNANENYFDNGSPYAVEAVAKPTAGNTCAVNASFSINSKANWVSATSRPAGHIELTWTNSTNPDITNYALRRGTTSGGHVSPYSDVVTWSQSSPLVTFDDSPATDGIYYYVIRSCRGACGTAGTLTVDSAEISAKSDNTNPIVVFNTPIAGDDKVNNSEKTAVQVSGSFTEAGTGISQVSVTAIGKKKENSSVPFSQTIEVNNPDSTFSVTFDLSQFADDSALQFAASAQDKAGNASTGPGNPSHNVELDTAAPTTATIANPASQAGGGIQLSWTVAADTARQDLYRVGTPDVPLTSANNNGPGNFTDTPPVDGTYSYKVRSFDTAGNVSDATKTGAISDRTSPTVTIGTVGKTADGYINSTEASASQDTVTGSANDGAGVKGMTVTVVARGKSAADGTTDVTLTPSSCSSGCSVNNNAGWTAQFNNLNTLANGTIVFAVKAQDSIGNPVSSEATLPVTLDKDQPGFVTSVPGNGSNANPPASTLRFQYNESLMSPSTAGCTNTVRNRNGTLVSGALSLATTNVLKPNDALVFTPDAQAPNVFGSPYTADVSVKDLSNNACTTAQIVTFKVNPATPVLSSPAAGQQFTTQSVPVSGTSERNVTINLSLNGSPLGTAVADSNGNWALNPTPTIPDGNHTLAATASYVVDGTTLISQPASQNFSVDTTPPPVPTGLTVAPNKIGSGNLTSVVVSGTSTNSSEVVVALTDGTTTRSQTVPVSANAFSATFNLQTSPLNDGALTAKAKSRDAAGNESAEAQATATKDTVAPAPTINALGAVNAANAGAYDVSGAVTEAHAIPSMTLTITSAGGQVGPLPVTPSGGSWSLDDVNVSSLGDGTLTFSVQATDDYGNQSPPVTRQVAKDVNAPSAAVSTADKVNIGSAGKTNATGTAADSGSGASGLKSPVTVEITSSADGNVTKVTATATPSTGSWSVSNVNVASLGDGTLTFKTIAEDNVGNKTTSAAKTALKDGTAPAVTLDTVPAKISSANQSAVPVSGTVADAGAGASGVKEVVVRAVAASDATKFVDTTATVTGAAWSASVNTSTLPEGQVKFIAMVKDNVDNATTSVEKTAPKDTEAAIALQNFTNPVNAGNVKNVTAGGSAPSDVAVFNLTITDQDGATVTKNGIVASNGQWSVSQLDLSALADSAGGTNNLTYAIQGVDAFGNPAGDSKAALKDTTAPGLTITTPVEITDANKTNVTIAGTIAGGNKVTVVLSDGTGSVTASRDGITGTTWSIAGINATLLKNGSISYQATAQDAAGNTTVKTATGPKNAGANPAQVRFGQNGNGFVTPAQLVDGKLIVSVTQVGPAPTAVIEVSVSDGTATLPAQSVELNAGQSKDVEFDPATLKDGSITAKARLGSLISQDVAVLDRGKPTATADAPRNPYVSSPILKNTDFTGTASDGTSVIDRVVVSLNANTQVNAQLSGYGKNVTWTASFYQDIAPGAYTLTVKVYDYAGNVSDEVTQANVIVL